MNPYLVLLLGSLVALVLQRRRIQHLKSVVRIRDEEIAAQCQEFGRMMDEFNHKTAISPASSVQGLIGLIIYAVRERCVKPLRRLYEKQDWNTIEVITELEGISETELPLSYQATADWLQTIRDVLRRFERHQYPKGSDGNP